MGEPREKAVLVIDDDADLRAAITEVLEQEGYRAQHAGDGDEGIVKLRYLAERYCCVVISDFQMPGTDGATFIKKLKREPALAHIRTIMMSGSNPPDVPMGEFAFIQKPFSLTQLLAIVARAFDAGS